MLKPTPRPPFYFSEEQLAELKQALPKLPGVSKYQKSKKNEWSAFLIDLIKEKASQAEEQTNLNVKIGDLETEIAKLKEEKAAQSLAITEANQEREQVYERNNLIQKELFNLKQSSESLDSQRLQELQELRGEVTKKSREIDSKKLADNQVVVTLQPELIQSVRVLRNQFGEKGWITNGDDSPSTLLNNALAEVVRIHFPNYNQQSQ